MVIKILLLTFKNTFSLSMTLFLSLARSPSNPNSPVQEYKYIPNLSFIFCIAVILHAKYIQYRLILPKNRKSFAFTFHNECVEYYVISS